MIEINFVPISARKKKQKASIMPGGIPKEMIIGLCGGLMALLVFVIISLQVFITLRYAEHKKLTKEWETLQPVNQRADVVIKELRLLQKKIKEVEKISVGKQILWSKKLNQISDSLPRGVWLNKIAFNDEILFVEGSAVSKGSDEMISVHRFASNLKEQGDFLDNLSDFELGSIQRRKIKTTEIADFSIRAKIK